MISKKLIQQATFVSGILDQYYQSGGNAWYRHEKTLVSLTAFLSKLEQSLLALAQINKNHKDLNLSRQIVYQDYRGTDSLIELWSVFHFEFWRERANFNIHPALTPWQSYLIYRLSDQNWLKDISSDYLILEHLFSPRLKLHQILWANSPFVIWENFNNSLRQIDLNIFISSESPGFEHQKQNQIQYLDKSLQKLYHSKEGIKTNLKTWRNYWKKNSGGIVSQFNAFRLETGKEIVLKGFNLSRRNDFKFLICNQENQKILVENIQKLLAGKPALNAYLWGEPGMGKSSSVLALVNYFDGQPLKLIEIHKTDLQRLKALLLYLGKLKEKFILFLDDFNFNANDPEVPLIKTLLDGSTMHPSNVVFHTTSNRQDLLLKPSSDTDAVEKSYLRDEVNALNDRFGLKLYFAAPRFQEIDHFLISYAERFGIKLKQIETIKLKFKRFCLENQHNKPSVRSIKQFFEYSSDLDI